MGRKNKKHQKRNVHDEPAVALCYDCGTRAYVVLDVHAQVIAVLEDEGYGWAKLHEAGYGELPMYGPVEVEPVVVEQLLNASKRDLRTMGPVLAGTIGNPIAKHFRVGWGKGQERASNYNPVEVKGKMGRTQKYDEPLKASIGDVTKLKSRLLKG